MYDVIIIGAGPCGLSCALELGKKGKKVGVIERGGHYLSRFCQVDHGRQCKKCAVCSVISGFGGSIHYGDAVKLSLFPSGKALYNILLDSYNDLAQRAMVYWNVTEDLFVNPKFDNQSDLSIKEYPVCVLSAENVKTNIIRLYKEIENNNNIDLILNYNVTDFVKNDGHFEVFCSSSNLSYCSKYLVISTGRAGMIWLKKLLKEKNIPFDIPEPTFGVRFEMPSKYLMHWGKMHPDLKIRIKKENRKYKTFCFCAGEHGGRIKYVNYGDFVLLDGHVLTEYDVNFGKSNFALLTKFEGDIKDEKSFDIAYAELIGKYKDLNKKNPGLPVCQSYINFKNNIEERDNSVFATTSAGSIQYGNVYDLFSDELKNEYCENAEQIFRFLNNDKVPMDELLEKILVIGLEIEGQWYRIKVDNNLESAVSGLYFGGDCGGSTQGALQATIMGIRIADHLQNRF